MPSPRTFGGIGYRGYRCRRRTGNIFGGRTVAPNTVLSGDLEVSVTVVTVVTVVTDARGAPEIFPGTGLPRQILNTHAFTIGNLGNHGNDIGGLRLP